MGQPGDQALAQSAHGSASGLPENLLVGTLGGSALDPRILHFFGTACADKPAVFDAVVLNPAVADATLTVLAAKGDARGVDQIAQNEQRLLAHPEIELRIPAAQRDALGLPDAP
jgi:hypothetical protein